MQFASPRCKVCKHDPNVHSTRKGTCAETSNRLWCDFGQIDGSNDGCLADAKSSNETARIHLTESTTIRKKDDNAEDPEEAELPCSPETTDTITKDECSSSQLAQVGRGLK